MKVTKRNISGFRDYKRKDEMDLVGDHEIVTNNWVIRT